MLHSCQSASAMARVAGHFNVTSNEAHGWHSEMFKRFHQSGSDAKFWGVTWYGDEGLVNAMNYHEDVVNAFDEDKEMSMKAGMDGHIAKPLKIDELLAELKQFAV